MTKALNNAKQCQAGSVLPEKMSAERILEFFSEAFSLQNMLGQVVMDLKSKPNAS